MSCPLCGANEECRCSNPEFQPRHVRRPRFCPDSPPRSFMGGFPETSDAAGETEPSEVSERQFVASVDSGSSSTRRPRFVLENAAQAERLIGERSSDSKYGLNASTVIAEEQPAEIPRGTSPDHQPTTIGVEQNQCEEPEDIDAMAAQACAAQQDYHWREEIAERVHSYRIRRRRRAPRYPSLSLKFESPEPYRAATTAPDLPAPRISLDLAPPEPAHAPARSYAAAAPAPRPANLEPKIIEFPKPTPPPLPILDVPFVELAEPVVEGPRILDAPEALPQVAPLGGITLEPPAETASVLELPLQVASVGSRLTAAVLDGIFVLLAAALFAWIAFKITTGMSARTLAEVTLGVAAVLWAVYHYVLITYSGSTPGMEMAQIRLSCFDGGSPAKSRRRGRTLAMMLSAISFCLGYLWCLFDEDTLCWHDRITRTYAIRGPRGGIFAGIGAFASRFFPERHPS